MAEAPRPRPIEYYNPRGLILGICFVWGIAVGFLLFYMAPPKVIPTQGSGKQEGETTAAPTQTTGRDEQILPPIADVQVAPATVRPRLESMILESPPPILTPEGGLTGRTAPPLAPRPAGGSDSPRRTPDAQPFIAPPPIPDLPP